MKQIWLCILFFLTGFINCAFGNNVYPNTYAVIIGISDYQDEDIPDLRFADKDAQAFNDYLQSIEGGGVSSENIKLLLNEQATMAKVASVFDWLWETAGEDDKVIIYFSGHGDVEKKTLLQPGYLLCWDAPARVYMSGGAFGIRMLQNVISTLSLQNKSHVLMIADACRSGKLSGSDQEGAKITGQNLSQQFANEVKILSCQPDQYSIEGEQWGGGRGAFSYHLINGLKGMADKNEDREITLREIRNYLETHVPEEVAPAEQLPMTIGNKKTPIAFINQPQNDPDNSQDVADAPMTRGVNLAPDMQLKLNSFIEAIKEKRFLCEDRSCAEAIFEELSSLTEMGPLLPSLKRDFAVALQDESQQVLNQRLKTNVNEVTLSKFDQYQKYKIYPEYLQRASELLGEGHYMYPILQSRKSYFEGYLITISVEDIMEEHGEAALKKFDEALKWQADLPHVYLAKSWVYGNAFLQKDSTLHYADLAIEQAPSWILPAYQTSYLLLRKFSEYEEAKVYLDYSYNLDSTNLVVLNNMGNYHWYKDDKDMAAFYYQKCIEQDPLYRAGHNNLALIYHLKDDFEKAEYHFQKAVDADSTYIYALKGLGKVYIDTKQYDKAEKALLRALHFDPTYSRAHNHLGEVYFATDRIEDAKKQYDKAIKHNDRRPDPYYNLAVYYCHLKNADAAVQSMIQSLERGFDDQEDLMSNPDFEIIRAANGFSDLLEKYFPEEK